MCHRNLNRSNLCSNGHPSAKSGGSLQSFDTDLLRAMLAQVWRVEVLNQVVVGEIDSLPPDMRAKPFWTE